MQVWQTYTKGNNRRNEEWNCFLVALVAFNAYIWLFSLQYEDEFISPLSHDSVQEMTESEFEDVVSKITPQFAKFERNCKDNYIGFTVDVWAWILSVLHMDWTYRLIMLFLLYQTCTYLENRYYCTFNKFVSKYVSTACTQSRKFKLSKRAAVCCLNMAVYFLLCMVDRQYTKWNHPNSSQDAADGLIDYHQRNWLERLQDFVYIYIRVHPTTAWLVRLSHGIAYPFTIYAWTRPRVSSFVLVHMLTIAFFVYHLGGIAHVLDENDLQSRCVRRSFLWSNRDSTVHGEALRLLLAPYLNVVCLTVNCAQYLL